MALKDKLRPILNIITLVSAFWMIGDVVLDVRQTSKYYKLSPYFNQNHEANLNMSTRLSTFCNELDEVDFDLSLLNETQKNLLDEWEKRCQNTDVNFVVLNPLWYFQ